MVDLGTLKAYDLRDIWQYEDRHFTVWLCDNLDRLAAALSMNLELREREKAVGPFSADILAHDMLRDRPVVIENQLEQTDHDHFGKLMTYAAGLEASAIVWISPMFREQHRAALDWLNNHTDDSIEFFGVVIEAIQIDESRPAINFKVVASPNNWQKSLIAQRSDNATLDERQVFLYQFNEAVVNFLRAGNAFQPPNPTPRHEFNIQRTHGGIIYMVMLSRNTVRATVSISFPDSSMNKRVFELLKSSQQDIERQMGFPLEWDYQEARHRQIIAMTRSDLTREESQIPEIARWTADALTKIKAVFEPRLRNIIAEAEQLASAVATGDAEY